VVDYWVILGVIYFFLKLAETCWFGEGGGWGGGVGRLLEGAVQRFDLVYCIVVKFNPYSDATLRMASSS